MSTADQSSQQHHQIETAIREVYEHVCQAFANIDIDAALRYFADSEQMVKISNGQVLRGKQQLAEYWRQRLGNAQTLRITIEQPVIHVIDERHAWATADEYITVDGHTRQAIVSNIFVLAPQGWKIVLDHTTYV